MITKAGDMSLNRVRKDGMQNVHVDSSDIVRCVRIFLYVKLVRTVIWPQLFEFSYIQPFAIRRLFYALLQK